MDKDQYALMYRIEDTHWWYVGMRGITDALLRRCHPDGRSGAVLDAGCGTGGVLCRFPEGVCGVGIDFSSDALDLCRERGLSRLARASVEHIPFAENSFDVVFSLDVVYHAGVSDDVAALREFCRVLRPGGIAVVRVPAYDWLRSAHDAAVHTRHRYTRSELRGKLAAAGFDVVRVTYANSLLFPLALVKRLLEGRLIRASLELESSSWLLQMLGSIALGMEARLVSRVDLPWGISVIGVGRKPMSGTAG